MDPITADLIAYYDQEAAIRAGRDVDPRRASWRDGFLDLLEVEERRHVIEVGCGPGRDAPGFIERGFRVTGVDLSAAALRAAAGRGVDAVQASLYNLPFPPGSFAAGWTMSTLVHVPDARFDEALGQICASLTAGAPLGLGLWGGSDGEGRRALDTIEPPRFFSSRSHRRLHQLLGRHGSIESFETHEYGTFTGGIYQFVVLRVP